MSDVGQSVATDVLLSDRVLDGVLSFLLVRAIGPGGDTSVQNLARWDLKAALIEALGRESMRRTVTTPFDDPIVQACIDNGGHFWPEDAPDDEPATCTRCWFNPGWKAGKPRNEASIRPVHDDPRAD